MFVKKLVEKAGKKPGGSPSEGLRANDVEPRVVLHYGIPSGAHLFAYDPVQKILAVSTKDGRIKLFGKNQTQALLVSEEASTSKFIEFVQNQGLLLNVNSKNQIEVWDLEKKLMSHVHVFNGEITSLRVMQHTPYFYVGDSSGNVSVLKIDQDSNQVIQMDYTIPYLASNGSPVEASDDTSVVSILPQPTAETKRILLVFSSGFITLWDIKESKPVLKTGGNGMVKQEAKKATCACWVCPSGSKVAVGYSNGDILIWSMTESFSMVCKLNLGYKAEKTPINSLKWVYAEGKASRVYATGSSSNSLQVVLLNDQTEVKMVKLGLHVSEPCVGMEMIMADAKQDSLLVLGKSGRVYAYDDYMIEKYLIQSQSKSPPSLPKESVVKLAFSDSCSGVTVGKFLTNSSHLLNLSDEDYAQLAKYTAPFLPSQIVSKEASRSAHFPGFTKVKNVYITGHSDGSIGVWDMSCPFLVPVLFLKEQQADQDISSRGTAALTALHFDSNSRLLVSGDQNGMVRLYRFKPEPYLTENSFIPFQGMLEKGNNHIVHSVKHIKLTGSITCIQKSQNSKHLAIGSDQGHVSLVDVEEATVLYTKHIASDICPGITSLQFESCSVQGFEKNVLVVAMRDSSVFSLDSDTGNMIGTNMVKPKKPFKALFMQILDGKQDSSGNGESIVEDVSTRQPSVLLCSEKAIYIYPLSQVVQGVKKVLHKKKFSSPSICSASTFYGTSGVGLILVFSDGTVEIRSLPELSLLKQISIRGFTYSSPKQNSLPEITISASWDGDLVMVNGDDELIVSSVLPQKETFRLVESLSRVYKKDNAVCQDGTTASAVASSPKEKKGMFGSVFKTKPKRAADTETTESTKETIEELSKIFTTANFPWNNNVERSRESNVVTRVGDEEELDIDDIDIEDDDDHQQQELPKEQGILSGISKQKLASKFTSFKGKLKQMTAKNEKSVEEKHEEKRGASIDQIKKKYGFASSSEEMGAAKMAQSKLQDNLKKLQGISLKTTEMEDTAKSFSSTAKELLNAVEFNKQSSKT
ncbi:BnaA03g53420D [Brassica napus]|uniref:BnaA03g53420D protein n=1 Tax=Brassica napus TaxID=3708 RepID=A0A078HSE3_BRANA|nr:BnaA03g53420D [Brassica napus]